MAEFLKGVLEVRTLPSRLPKKKKEKKWKAKPEFLTESEYIFLHEVRILFKHVINFFSDEWHQKIKFDSMLPTPNNN